MVKFSIGDYILLGLALAAQGLDETVGAGSRAYHYRKLGFYNPPGYKNDYFEATLRRLLKKKYLNGEIQNQLELTDSGWRQLKEDFPFIDWQKEKWDGNWRLVVFDVAIKDNALRQKLRRELLRLKLGQLQQSIYITPHKIEEKIWRWLRENKLEDQAGVLIARQLFVDNLKSSAEKIWHLSRLNRLYGRLEKMKAEDELSAKEWLKHYLEIVVSDPFLPPELLPLPWRGFKAQKIWRKIIKQYAI